jgi:ABC-type sugar transport system ATPase subunit
MAKIILEQVTKLLMGDGIAVSDVSLEIADGEFIVLVGSPAAASPQLSV